MSVATNLGESIVCALLFLNQHRTECILKLQIVHIQHKIA